MANNRREIVPALATVAPAGDGRIVVFRLLRGGFAVVHEGQAGLTVRPLQLAEAKQLVGDDVEQQVPDAAPPWWYDATKLIKIFYAYSDYTGWAVDMGDGTAFLANSPMLGTNGPKWGQRVQLLDSPEAGWKMIDPALLDLGNEAP
jgi:hypothetical protein